MYSRTKIPINFMTCPARVMMTQRFYRVLLDFTFHSMQFVITLLYITYDRQQYIFFFLPQKASLLANSKQLGCDRITTVELMERIKHIPVNKEVRKHCWHWIGHAMRKPVMVELESHFSGTHRAKETG